VPVLLEWGPTGAAALAPDVDVAVVVDVLSFSTTVSVAADRGIDVVPHAWADDSAGRVARERSAELAVARSDAAPGRVTLSPASFRAAAADLRRVVLPSPNGSTVCAVLADAGVRVVVASLRNATAVARALGEIAGAGHASAVLLVPAGERWPDGSLRPAVEDLWGAGAVADALTGLAGLDHGTLGDEAEGAAAAYRLVRHRIGDALARCASGRELVAQGHASDVTIAAEVDTTTAVPWLVDGVLTSRSTGSRRQ
jgi:2-phosphosulfolactate phosphatase